MDRHYVVNVMGDYNQPSSRTTNATVAAATTRTRVGI
jgi:hypothetical protein